MPARYAHARRQALIDRWLPAERGRRVPIREDARGWLMRPHPQLAVRALIALAGLTLVWSRLSLLGTSLWADEAASVTRYITPGPSGIWDAKRWIPNNHLLFDVVTWITVNVLGVGYEAVYRLWSTIPAIAAAALLTWWLWRRIDIWAAAVFAVLITVSPLFYDLGTQARGYGLAFLAMATMLVSADALLRSGARGALVLFALSGAAGTATLPNFVAAYVGVAAVLMVPPELRRRVLLAVALVGAAMLAWYAPLLSTILGYHNGFGSPLPWYGAAWAPLRDFFGATVTTLDHSIAQTTAAIVSGIVVVSGAVLLWLRGERHLVLLLLAAAAGSFLVIELVPGETGYLPRFVSFAILPLFALGAIGLSLLVGLTARARRVHLAALTVLVIASLLTLDGFVRYTRAFAARPIEEAKTAGAIVHGLGLFSGPVVTNKIWGAYPYYIPHMRALSTTALEHMFCTYTNRFVYIEEDQFPPQPDTTCLLRRSAGRIYLPQRRPYSFVWIVPRLSRP